PFEQVLTESLRRSTVLLAALLAVGIVVFLVVEAIARFDPALFAIRTGSAAALTALLLTFRRAQSPGAILGFAFAVYLVGAGLVASIVVLSGGTQSPYFVV